MSEVFAVCLVCHEMFRDMSEAHGHAIAQGHPLAGVEGSKEDIDELEEELEKITEPDDMEDFVDIEIQ